MPRGIAALLAVILGVVGMTCCIKSAAVQRATWLWLAYLGRSCQAFAPLLSVYEKYARSPIYHASIVALGCLAFAMAVAFAASVI